MRGVTITFSYSLVIRFDVIVDKDDVSCSTHHEIITNFSRGMSHDAPFLQTVNHTLSLSC